MTEDTPQVGAREDRDEETTIVSSAGSAKMWRDRIAKCKAKRDDLVDGWADNVDFRRGKPFTQESDTDRINVNLDWTLTKSKHAQLFSQVPQLYLTPKKKQFASVVPIFAKQLNARLTQANLGAAVDEAVLDAINASGIGAALVSYEAKTAPTQVPEIDLSMLPPEQAAAAMQSGSIKMIESVQTFDKRFRVRRLSPSDLLWDDDFTGSDFDQSPWLGYSGRMFWSEAKAAFDLDDTEKEKICGTASREHESLRNDEGDREQIEDVVEYDEIFYWANCFDPNERYFKKIKRIVFVNGRQDPVKDEDWAGQRFDEMRGSYVGACKLPIRILTLTYISDDVIPPSDTAVGRPQVLEMIRTRTQVLLQRERSLPMRWANTNIMDPIVLEGIMKGTWQNIIPTPGTGDKVLGEISRATYPNEDFAFNKQIQDDLSNQWQVGANQMGNYASGERSAREAGIVQQNFQSRIGYERSRVAAFITGIAEVMSGLIALFDDFEFLDDEEIARLQTWDLQSINGEFVYYIRPDSTVLLDANQRVEQLMRTLNLVGKSGYVNPKPMIEEIVSLGGVDPELVMIDPQPPKPDSPKIALSFKGEDFINPVTAQLAVALMMASGQAPTPEQMQAAAALLRMAIAPAADGSLPLGQAPEGQDTPPLDDPMQQADVRPEWTPAGRITKRYDEIGG